MPKSTYRGLLLLLMTVAVSAASTAHGGAGPLPDGVFGDGTGYVPEDPKLLKRELKAQKAEAVLAGKLEKCLEAGTRKLAKSKPDEVAACLFTSLKSVVPKYEAAIEKIDAKEPGLPACNDFAADGDEIVARVKGFQPLAYCDDSAGAVPLPAVFGGGYMPVDPAAAKNLRKASAARAKLSTKAYQCFEKGVRNLDKDKPHGVEECLRGGGEGALDKYESTIAKIAAKSPGLPSCHDFVAHGEDVVDLVRQTQAELFCAP